MNAKGIFRLVKFHNYNAFVPEGTIFERTCTNAVPSSIAGKPMAAQEGAMSPFTKFGIDTSMHRRDMDLLPVWRVGAGFDWVLRAIRNEIKKYTR